MQIVYDSNDFLCHYGVLGMKWGHRKSRAKKSSGNRRRSRKSNVKLSKKKTKRLSDATKQKIKTVAKTTAKVAGSIAAASILGYAGSVAFSEITRAFGGETSNQNNSSTSKNSETPKTFADETPGINRFNYVKGEDGKSHKVDVNIIDPTEGSYASKLSDERLSEEISKNKPTRDSIFDTNHWKDEESHKRYSEAIHEQDVRDMMDFTRKHIFKD